MKTECNRYLLPALFILLITWTISCSGRAGKTGRTESSVPAANKEELPVSLIRMTLPEDNAEFRLHDEVKISVAPVKSDLLPDSVKVFFGGKQVALLKSAPWECSVGSSVTTTTGRKPVRAVAYRNDRIQAVTRFIIVYSDITPKIEGYKVIHTYPHDNQAFTQGLFYDRGFLYEGTGQEAGSSLRKVDLETGRVLMIHNLDPSLFGEGITLYKQMIFQVTWTNKIGFVYDESTFELLNRIYYQTEGWGLTTIDNRIIMSDGTNMLYFMDPEMFTVDSQLEVYDNEKKVDKLNELEYINGEIWANIWMTDLIARIDPKSGRVNAYVDLATIYPEAKRREDNADVLNGIAWDKQGGRIFVTGKKWPNLFQITVFE